MNAEYRPHLEPRELKLLDLMNRGLTNGEIAERLGLKTSTVGSLASRVTLKFGGGGRRAAIARARSWGIVATPQDVGLEIPRPEPPQSVHLSPREREILELLNRGFDAGRIAEQTGLNRMASRHYVRDVVAKLGGENLFEAMQTARRLGLVKALVNAGPSKPVPVSFRLPPLTPRERETLGLMNHGLSNGQIAEAFGISLSGARCHVTNVTTRLNGASRVDTVHKARELGLVVAPKGGGVTQITLTPRQRSALLLAARPMSVRQIARELGQRVDCVSNLLGDARRRLNVETTVAAVDRAVELGILTIARPTLALNPFTKRELELLHCLHAGMSHRDAALHLQTSGANVATRLRYMRSRLRVRDNGELLAEAVRLSLFSPRLPRAELVKRSALTKRLPPSHDVEWFTSRRLAVIEAISRRPKGMPLRDVASQLGLSKGTLDVYLFEIRMRLGAHSTRAVPDAAYKLGLIRKQP